MEKTKGEKIQLLNYINDISPLVFTLQRNVKEFWKIVQIDRTLKNSLTAPLILFLDDLLQN